MYKLLLGFVAIATMSFFMSCEGPEGPAGADAQHGQFRGSARETAAPGQYQSRPGRRPGRFEGDRPPDCDHQFDDAEGKAVSEDHRRLAQAPHRRRSGAGRPGREPVAEAASADAEDDAAILEDGR